MKTQMRCTAVEQTDSETSPKMNFEVATTAVVRASVEQWLQQHYSLDATVLDRSDSTIEKASTQQHEEEQAKNGMHCTVVYNVHDSEYTWESFKDQVDAIQRACAHQMKAIHEEHAKMIRELQQKNEKVWERRKDIWNLDCAATLLKENAKDFSEYDSTCEPSECNSDEWSATDLEGTQQLLPHKEPKEPEVVNGACQVPRLPIPARSRPSCRPPLAPSFPPAPFPHSLSVRKHPPIAPPFPPVPPPSS